LTAFSTWLPLLHANTARADDPPAQASSVQMQIQPEVPSSGRLDLYHPVLGRSDANSGGGRSGSISDDISQSIYALRTLVVGSYNWLPCES
jgi:hypothetical protein